MDTDLKEQYESAQREIERHEQYIHMLKEDIKEARANNARIEREAKDKNEFKQLCVVALTVFAVSGLVFIVCISDVTPGQLLYDLNWGS